MSATIKSVFGAATLELQRSIFGGLAEHGKTHPGEVDAIVAMIVSHLRSWRPESCSPLCALPPPGPIRDPRGAA